MSNDTAVKDAPSGRRAPICVFHSPTLRVILDGVDPSPRTDLPELTITDLHRVRAAEGWLELGNPVEAEAELGRVSADVGVHPDLLHLRWQICRCAKNWDQCLETATALTRIAPADPRAWTAMAQTLYFTRRIAEAYDLAVSKITRFPTHWPLYYDAACYACLTGRLDQARQFLRLASTFGDEAHVKKIAADDPDLKPLREPV